jgi:hypothetical protein
MSEAGVLFVTKYSTLVLKRDSGFGLPEPVETTGADKFPPQTLLQNSTNL